MGCPHEPEVRLLLEGLLDAEQTRRMMDHIRNCDDCRGRLEFRTQAEGATTTAGQPPTYRRYDPGQVLPSESRRGRTWVRGIIAMAAVIGLTFIATRADLPESRPTDIDREAVVSVRAGQALVRWPEGELARRPRFFEVVLPKNDVQTFTLRVSFEGAAVWEKEVRKGDKGVVFDPVVLEDKEAGRTEEARLVSVPFPDSKALQLPTTGSLAVRVFLGERPGPTTQFHLLATEASEGR